MHIGKCIYHLSPKKALLTVNGDHHKKSYLDVMQRSMDLKEPSPNRYMHVTASPVMAREGETERL